MPSDEPNAREAGGLTAWSRAQQVALYHKQLAEQYVKDETKAEKDAKEKKAKKKHDKENIKPDKITAASIVAKILHGWCPALYEFLDIFGPPHIGLPIFISLHVLYWATSPWYLSLLLPLPLTHLLPISLSLKSLFSPSSALDKAYDESKRTWSKTTEQLKKSGKDGVEFPDPPTPPEGWQVCVRDRKVWLAYWVWVGGIEYLEVLCFGDQAAGLIWWPKIKAVFFVALYFIWEVDEKGHQTTGALKLIDPFLPVPHEDKHEKGDKRDKNKEKAKEKSKEQPKKEDPRKK